MINYSDTQNSIRLDWKNYFGGTSSCHMLGLHKVRLCFLLLHIAFINWHVCTVCVLLLFLRKLQFWEQFFLRIVIAERYKKCTELSLLCKINEFLFILKVKVVLIFKIQKNTLGKHRWSTHKAARYWKLWKSRD